VLEHVPRLARQEIQLEQKLPPSHLLCGYVRQRRFQKLEKDLHLNLEQTF
jgi:hypothetical protein